MPKISNIELIKASRQPVLSLRIITNFPVFIMNFIIMG